jgi:hypothetical protein
MAPSSDVSVHLFRNKWIRSVLSALPSAFVIVGLAQACTLTSKSSIERAEFGVLFGGQVQERSEIPFELDASKQTLGFVITLNQPLASPATLHWELSKPGPLPASRVPNPIDRRIELFEAPVAAGQTQVQKSISIEPGDSLGLWNLRVTLGDQLAIDRAFMVFDAGSRSRKAREPKANDAGL